MTGINRPDERTSRHIGSNCSPHGNQWRIDIITTNAIEILQAKLILKWIYHTTTLQRQHRMNQTDNTVGGGYYRGNVKQYMHCGKGQHTLDILVFVVNDMEKSTKSPLTFDRDEKWRENKRTLKKRDSTDGLYVLVIQIPFKCMSLCLHFNYIPQPFRSLLFSWRFISVKSQ